MVHLCIYTRDFGSAHGFIRALSDIGVLVEPHANRTRFWLNPEDPEHLLFYIRYSSVIHRVDPVTI